MYLILPLSLNMKFKHLYSISQIQNKVFSSIYLFSQHIISFWRSHSPYSQLYYKQRVKNASEMRWDVVQRTTVPIWRSLHERFEDCVAWAAGSGPPGSLAYPSRPQSPGAPRLPRD